MSHRILVVDDEPDITALVAYHLAKSGYRVSTAANGPDALKAAREERPDVVILDVMLPGASGYDVLDELRRRDETKEVGVILLTARREEPDRIRGLTLGADDYLTKPFSPHELTLRVSALIRRLGAPAVAGGNTITAGPVVVDRSEHKVMLDGKELVLTATEYKLLVMLLERRGRVQSRPQLLETVWDAQPDIQTRTVDMHVQRLRSKLGPAGEMIETVRGFGYRFKSIEKTGEGSVNLPGRLVMGTILVLVAAMAVLVWASEVSLRRDLEQDLAVALEREARVIAIALPTDSIGQRAAVHRFSRENGHRITLISPTGRVIAESDAPDAALGAIADHSDRPEIRAALATGSGRDIRQSATFGAPLLYVATRAPAGVLRVAAPYAQVDDLVRRAQTAVISAAFLALVAGSLLAFFTGRNVARPLTEIGQAARAIAAGITPRFPRSGIPDVDALVQALRQMHSQLGDRFEQLQREQAEVGAVLEAMTEGVIAADARGRIVTANAAAHRLLGYTAGAPLPELPQLFRARAARDVVAALMAGDAVAARELDLEGRTLLASGRPLPEGGAVLVLHDLTDLRRLETVRRDFVANVSHELKTPLTSISGYAETLLGDKPDAATSERFLEVILGNARRMQRLVDSLLDLSRIESGSWQPSIENLNIAAVARETWAGLAAHAAARQVEFIVDADDAAPMVVAADADALRQVLTNVLDNALRYTPAGGRIVCRTRREPGGIVVSVSDSGSGIPRDHLSRIFERFYRADPSRSRDEGGTGLGLAIVRHLVEAHGGRVWAESELGQGTTIFAFLPDPSAS